MAINDFNSMENITQTGNIERQGFFSMDSKKLKKTLLVAFFVSMAAQLNFSYFANGFIIAMSSVVMAIFVYCYEDLSPAYIITLSGITSPLVRALIEYIRNNDLSATVLTVFPDMVFFFTYAAVYVGMYKYIFKTQKTMSNFPVTIFFCDMLSNTAEILVRSLIMKSMLLDPQVFAYLAIIALVRTAIIMMVIIAIESYGNFLINKEHNEEYKRLLTQASAIEGEMRVMTKNVQEVEGVMKKAYDLYYQTKDQAYPKELTDRILEIAKDTHEIKGDYQNVLGVINNTFLGNLKDEKLMFSEIVSLEKANVLSIAEKNGWKVDISTKVKSDFRVNMTFKLMSVIRNLMTNSAEAIGKGPGKIVISAEEIKKDPDLPFSETSAYRVSVRDNGPGIPEDQMKDIFLEGYSTKFDPVTGNIERGLGLSLVKDFVENDFNGRISIESEVGKYTEFILELPADAV